MSNELWSKIFQIARDMGDDKDLEIVEALVGKYRKFRRSDERKNIQLRWDARKTKQRLQAHLKTSEHSRSRKL